MNKKRISSTIIESMIQTLKQLGISTQTITSCYIKGSVTHVQIEFVGDVKGYLILEMSPVLACKIANVMLAGMTSVDSIDKMCESVLGEACNMISGGICTALSNIFLLSDIKPPYVDIRQKGLNPEQAISLIESDTKEYINVYFIYT